MFSGATYCLSIFVVGHLNSTRLSSLFSEFLVCSHYHMFSVLALTLKKTAEDDKFLTMISGLWVIFLKESFPCRNTLIGVIGVS